MISKIGNKGFTLIEVVVTVAILSIGITGILRAFIVSVDAIGASQEYITAVSLAKEKMSDYAQSEIENHGIPEGKNSGNFHDPFDSIHWESQVSSSDVKDLNILKVSVSNTGINLPKGFTLVSYVQNQKKSEF